MSDRVNHGTLHVASVFGIPIYIHASLLAILAFISWILATGYSSTLALDALPAWGWRGALIASALLFVSVLLHEMGHTVVALKHGLGIRSITLFIFGGIAELEKEPEDGWTELKVTAIGPAVNLALALFFYLVNSVSVLGFGARTIAWFAAGANLALAGFNVLPAFPLDGGRLLRAVLWIHHSKRRATQIASGAGTFLAMGVTFFGVFRLLRGDGVTAVGCVLLGWFLKDAALFAYARVRFDDALRGLTVRDAMLTKVATIPAHLALSELASENFLRGGYNSYPVVRGDGVVGLLSVREILALSPAERERTSVQAVMMRLGESIVVGPGEPLLGVMTRMARNDVRRLLVVEDGRLAGLLSLSSVFRQMGMREALSI
jgi:Zn-dependent protease